MDKINCDMDICMYNESGQCELDIISITNGMCDSCTYIMLPEKVLNKYKAKQLARQKEYEIRLKDLLEQFKCKYKEKHLLERIEFENEAKQLLEQLGCEKDKDT